MMRDMIFVSHANPEDNDAARWLALQLAREGYAVWCDLTRFLGGEDFWRDAEKAIRERTAKFLFLLSRESNSKQGALDELQVAKNVARDLKLTDFIVPLRLDDLPPREANIRLANLHMVSFNEGWAPGFAQLLKKLAEDGIKKNRRFSATSVTRWWKRHYRREELLRKEPERLISNWFVIDAPPPLRVHTLHVRYGTAELRLAGPTAFPVVLHDQHLVSFANGADLAETLPPGVSIRSSRVLALTPEAEKDRREFWTYEQEHNALVDLLQQAWARLLRDRALQTYAFANGSESMYFTSGLALSDKVSPPKFGARQTQRQVVGFATIRKATAELPARLRYWHFGLEARPTLHPQLGYAMKPHVLFSDDGKTIWENKSLLHRARRSQCANWWNDEWRDRLLGTVLWLSGGATILELQVGSTDVLKLRSAPLEFTSPLTYDDSGFKGPPLDEAHDDDAEEDSDAGDETA